MGRPLPPNETNGARSRATFWKQIDEAADATDGPGLDGRPGVRSPPGGDRAVQDNQRRRVEAQRQPVLIGALSPGTTTSVQRFSNATRSRLSIARTTRHGRLERRRRGRSASARSPARWLPLPTTHPMKIQGVPGGLPTGVSLVSFDKDAFQSYGLEGTANAGIGYRAAEGYCRALTALIQEKLPNNPPTRLRVGAIALSDLDARSRLEGSPATSSDRSKIRPRTSIARIRSSAKRPSARAGSRYSSGAALVESVHAGKSGTTGPRRSEPALLPRAVGQRRAGDRAGLSRGSARRRSREHRPLVRRLVDRPKLEAKGATSTSGAFPIWMLAAATARKSEDVGPEIYPLLLSAALRGPAAPLPDSILVACLSRNRAEASQTRCSSPRGWPSSSSFSFGGTRQ